MTQAATDFFPAMGADEFEALKRDIAEHGQREPIVMVDGELVDGRNRLRACEELGIEPVVRNLTGAEAGDVFALVMSLNFHRRHLKPHEKGAALAAFMDHVGAKRQAGPGRPRKSESVSDNPQTLPEVAKALGIEERTARNHLKAHDDYAAAAPDLKAKVDAGEITAKKARAMTEKAKKVVEVAANTEDRHVTEATLASLVAQAEADEANRFACIYADPPWQYGNQATRNRTDGKYDTMGLEDIVAMPVKALAATNAHLHLWTTNAFLFEARRVMEAWGFTYKSCFVWVKPQMGMGNYWRVSHEFLLFGMRGSCPFMAKNEKSWISLPRGEHSAKPHEIRKLIERVSPGPRIELFARERHVGWSAFGNQVPSAPEIVVPTLALEGL